MSSAYSADFRPHAYDPYDEPDLFRGVLTRRVIAFLIDLIYFSLNRSGCISHVLFRSATTCKQGASQYDRHC